MSSRCVHVRVLNVSTARAVKLWTATGFGAALVGVSERYRTTDEHQHGIAGVCAVFNPAASAGRRLAAGCSMPCASGPVTARVTTRDLDAAFSGFG